MVRIRHRAQRFDRTITCSNNPLRDATHAPLEREQPREYQKTPQDENTLLLLVVITH